LIIALLAVILGPLISFVIAKLTIRSQTRIAAQNIRAEVLSRNRQEWINTLRDNIAQFISLISTFAIEIKDRNKKNTLDKMERVLLLQSMILLLINPKEEDHGKLDALMRDAIACLGELEKGETGEKNMPDIREEMLQLSQQILKREWKRVKKVE
jgi:hypothetical protein